MYKLTNGMWIQIVFCKPPKETEEEKIVLEYTEMLNLSKGWSVITAYKVESDNFPTDKWGVVLLRDDKEMAEHHLKLAEKSKQCFELMKLRE